MSRDLQRLAAAQQKAIEALQEDVFASPPADWAEFKLRQGQWMAYREQKAEVLLILRTDEE